MFTPRAPIAPTRFASAMHVSMSHAGMSGIGRSRSPELAWISAIWSL